MIDLHIVVDVASIGIDVFKMAEPCARALRQRLDDDSVRLSTRLKLARKTLASKQLTQLRNRENLVVDWLVESLVTLEASVENEGAALKLWKALFKVLKDSLKEISQGRTSRLGALLPNSFGNVLLKWIAYVKSTKSDNTLAKWVINCGERVLRTKLLDSFLSRNLEALNSLVLNTLDLLCFLMQCQSQSVSSLCSVVLALLKSYTHSQHLRGDVVKGFGVVSTSLLGQSANYIIYNRGTGDETFHHKFQQYVNETIINTLYKSSIPTDFGQLLVSVLINEGPPQAHLQYLVDFLALIQSCNSKVRNDLLVQMFDSNADLSKKIRRFCTLHYLVLLCRLLGIDAQDSKGKFVKSQKIFTVEFTDDEDCFSHLAAVLHRLSEIAPTTRIAQEVELLQPLKYFQSLADFLLQNSNCRSSSWFHCFTLLLKLDSTILVSTRTLLVIEKSWLISAFELDSEAQNARSELLCALLDIHAKLRQVDRFVVKLLAVLEKAEPALTTNSLRPPIEFLDKFGTICTDFHALQVVAVWNLLLTAIRQSLDKVADNKSGDLLQTVNPVIDLLKTLLRCARLVDVNLSTDALNAIVLASHATARHCSKDLIDKVLKLKITPTDLLINSLQLVHSWGELHTMLINYDNKYAQVWHSTVADAVENELSISDFLSQHFYLSDSDVDRVRRTCEKSKDAALNRAHLLLVLQKLKLLIVFGDENYDGWKDSLQASIRFLIELVKYHIKRGYSECWGTTCQNLPVIAPWMSPTDVQEIASEIVSTFTAISSDQNNCLFFFSDNRLGHVTSLLLHSHEFQDVGVFQSAIVNANMQRMAIISYRAGKDVGGDMRKKIKKVLKTMSINHEAWILPATAFSGSNNVTRNEEVLNEVSTALGKILSTEPKIKQTNISECYDGRFSDTLSLLEQLPLEYLLRENRMRCVVQALCALYLATDYDIVNTDSAKLAQCALRIAISLLSGHQKEKLTSALLPIRKLLTWVTGPFLVFVGKVQTNFGGDTQEIDKDLIHLTTELLTHVTTNLVVSGGYVLVDFAEFLEDFKLKQSMVMKPSGSTDKKCCLKVIVCALAMLRALHQVVVEKPSKVKVCQEYASLLSHCFARWFSAVKTTIQKESFDLVSAFLEAFGLILRLETVIVGDKVLEEDIVMEDVEAAWKQSIALVFECALSQVCARKDPSFRRGFYRAVDFLKEFRPFLPDSIVKDLWIAINDLDRSDTSVVDNLSNQNMSNSCLDILIIQSNAEDFTWILQNLLSNLMIDDLIPGKTTRIERSLCEWSAIMKAQLTSEKMELVLRKSGRFLMLCQHILIQTDGKGILAVMLMRTEAELLKKQMTSENMMLILQGCCSIDLTKIKEREQFVRCFGAVHGILRNILVYQARFMVHAVPAFLASVQHLMRSIIVHGQQHLLKNLSENQITGLSNCAQKLGGLFAQMTEYKVDFAKVAPYVIAFYVTEAPSVTLYPAIKNSLSTGIFSMMSICNAVDIKPLLVALGQSGREVFNVLHTDYMKYYRYTGKI